MISHGVPWYPMIPFTNLSPLLRYASPKPSASPNSDVHRPPQLSKFDTSVDGSTQIQTSIDPTIT